jgi:hypothetical protein
MVHNGISFSRATKTKLSWAFMTFHMQATVVLQKYLKTNWAACDSFVLKQHDNILQAVWALLPIMFFLSKAICRINNLLANLAYLWVALGTRESLFVENRNSLEICCTPRTGGWIDLLHSFHHFLVLFLRQNRLDHNLIYWLHTMLIARIKDGAEERL